MWFEAIIPCCIADGVAEKYMNPNPNSVAFVYLEGPELPSESLFEKPQGN